MNTQIVATITAPAKEWIAALGRLSPVTVGKKPLPVLNCLRVDPSAQQLFAAGQHGSAETSLVESSGQGEPFLVPAAWLRDAITSTTGRNRSAEVKVASDGKQVTVEAMGYKLSAEAMPIAEFPESEAYCTFDSHSLVDAVELREALGRALIAADSSEMLPVLASVHFKSSPSGVALWSTDRYRLTSGFVGGHGYGDEKFTVPSAALKLLVKQFKAGSVSVDLAKGGKVVFTTAETIYAVTPIEGDYPRLAELFDVTPRTVADVDRVQLLEAAKVAHQMSERNTPVYLTISEDGVLAKFNDGVFGPDVAPLAAGSLTGDPIEIAFNTHYFLQTINSFKGEKVRFHGASPVKPFSFMDGGADTTDATLYRHLLMPVRMPRG